MIGPRYSSRDFYHTLVALEKMLLDFPCRGVHEDAGVAWKNILEFIQTEREACSLRAALADAQNKRKERLKKERAANGL